MRAMVYLMVDIIVFQVALQKKMINFVTFKPKELGSLYYQYILMSKNTHKKSESSLYSEAIMIQYLFSFLKLKKINNLQNFTYTIMQEFYTYLKCTLLTKQQKTLSQSSQRLVYTFFKNFSFWLYSYHPDDAPPLNIFQKSPYKRNNENLKTKYFSDYTLQQIKDALVKEEDIYTKAYIMISLHYGLRSMDIITLQSNCLQISEKDSKYDLHYIDHKQNENVTIPAIISPVAKAIASLIHHTQELRDESNLCNLFIIRNRHGHIRQMDTYQKNMLDKFVKYHNITNESKELVKISSHMFRRTLATNLQSSGVSLETTQLMLNHKSKRTTLKHYIKTKEQDYIDQIGSLIEHMQVIAEDDTATITKLFSNAMDLSSNTLRLADGYCTNSAMVTQADYICTHLKKRANCYGCDKMVTTPNFLPYFKRLAAEKKEELVDKAHYGVHVLQHIAFELELVQGLITKLELL